MDERLVTLLKSHRNILIFTGAGISTGSGIPDYRGPKGVWQTRQPVYYQDFMSNHSARVEYWDYKLEGWKGFRDAKPNAVHHAIRKLEQAERLCMVVTQNIDGLHSVAGTSDNRLVELHGSNLAVDCQECGLRSDPQEHFELFEKTNEPPLCTTCGGYLKPATISFGQSLRESDLTKASKAASMADMVISLGSTLSVQPACSIPLLAAERGVPYVIINRGATEHDTVSMLTLRLEGDVVDLLPSAVDAALAEKT